jgi:hypothetical protein
MSYLMSGMYSRISAATAHDVRFFAKYCAEAFLQLCLYGMGIFLNLPAMVAGAIVGDIEEVAGQGFSYWLLVIGYWLLVIGYWLLVMKTLGSVRRYS